MTSSHDALATYTENLKAADADVSARKTRKQPLAVAAKHEPARDLVGVAQDLKRVEARQAKQRQDLAITDSELAALQKELKALVDQAGKQK